MPRSPREILPPSTEPAPTEASLAARVAALRSRGEIKRMAESLDADPVSRGLLESLAARRGLEPWPGISSKQLLRLVLDRAAEAQTRTNPIHRDERFTCERCGLDVPPGGAMVRDHCPRCLRGKHVDVVPGDRAADCGGTLEPVSLTLRAGIVLIEHRCGRCAHSFLVRAHPDDRVPPSLSVADLPGAKP